MKFQRILAAPAFLLLATSTLPVHAGGIEHYCNGTTELIERWPSPSNIPWSVHSGAAGTMFCPGYVPALCGGFSSPNMADWPLLQSLIGAANAWRNANAPGVPNASTFSLASTPNLFAVSNWTQLSQTHMQGLAGPDGMNLVTCWEPAGTFTFLGGPTVLAVTDVGLNFGTGDILETDIAFNVQSVNGSGLPYWSFVETNVLFGVTQASLSGAGGTTPVLGFADVQGVATHEFGHFAGLGHSVIESSANATSSRFPCMFPFAQTLPYSATVALPNSSCSAATYPTVAVSGTILGTSARTLRRDDVSAIGDGYPTASYLANLGTISGTISNWGSPVQGASVVAIAKRSPDVIRTATLSYANGNYAITGLIPGDYYVYVEPVDQNPAPFFSPDNGYYFSQLVVPNYVYLGSSGCATPLPFDTEFYDSGETSVETSNLNATLITVTAGAATTANFAVNFSGNLLTVRDATAGFAYASPHGVIVIGSGGTYPTIEARISAGAAWANSSVTIYFNDVRQTRQIAAQLSEVAPGAGAGIPATITGTTDAAGNFTTTVPLTTASAYESLFLQARLVKSGANVFTNTAIVWVTN